jgi:DNA gyrase inhibitor GyrI
MNLTEQPDVVEWPAVHYVFVEKVGPFMETAREAWTFLHANLAGVTANGPATRYMSVYKMDPPPQLGDKAPAVGGVYRAGVTLADKPAAVPEGFRYEELAGGKYSRFLLTGSFKYLPEACGAVQRRIKDIPIPLRPDGYYIEHYTNDPKTTPEEKLVTEILVPTA